MLDEVIAEPLARHLRGFETLGRLPQGRRKGQALRELLVVSAAHDRRLGLGLGLYPPKARRQGRGVGDVGIGVGGGDAVLDPLRLLRAADRTERAGAVVHPPTGLGRRPEAGDQPGEGIDRRRDHRQQLPHQLLLAGDEVAHGVGDIVGRLGVVEGRLSVLTFERQVDMAALAGPVGRPLGHEGGHQAVALCHHLGEGLEQRRLVRRCLAAIDRDRRLEHAGSGLLVQGFETEIHALAGAEKLAVEIRVHRVAQHRIAEEAGRHGLEVTVVLLPRRMRRLVEEEEFVLEAGVGLEAHVAATLDHPAQHASGAKLVGRWRELAKEEQGAVLERDVAAAFRQYADRRVRVARVPAGIGDVVVKLIVGIPAQHHVTETEAAIEGREELSRRHVLAAHDAVDIEQADLDVAELALFHDLAGAGGVGHLSRVHLDLPRCPPAVMERTVRQSASLLRALLFCQGIRHLYSEAWPVTPLARISRSEARAMGLGKV